MSTTLSAPRKADPMRCPACHREIRNGTFFVFGAHVMSEGAARDETAGDDCWVSGSVALVYHDDHDPAGEMYEVIEMAPSLEHENEHDVYFCSTQCLRTWLSAQVDALEGAVERERQFRRTLGQ